MSEADWLAAKSDMSGNSRGSTDKGWTTETKVLERRNVQD